VAVTANIVDGYGNPAPADQITWFSNSPNTAIVSNNSFVPGTENTVSTNTIIAISNGSAVITCTVNGTLMNTVNVTVSSPDPSLIEFVIGTPAP
jgi:hypothetical protein